MKRRRTPNSASSSDSDSEMLRPPPPPRPALYTSDDDDDDEAKEEEEEHGSSNYNKNRSRSSHSNKNNSNYTGSKKKTSYHDHSDLLSASHFLCNLASDLLEEKEDSVQHAASSAGQGRRSSSNNNNNNSSSLHAEKKEKEGKKKKENIKPPPPPPPPTRPNQKGGKQAPSTSRSSSSSSSGSTSLSFTEFLTSRILSTSSQLMAHDHDDDDDDDDGTSSRLQVVENPEELESCLRALEGVGTTMAVVPPGENGSLHHNHNHHNDEEDQDGAQDTSVPTTEKDRRIQLLSTKIEKDKDPDVDRVIRKQYKRHRASAAASATPETETTIKAEEKEEEAEKEEEKVENAKRAKTKAASSYNHNSAVLCRHGPHDCLLLEVATEEQADMAANEDVRALLAEWSGFLLPPPPAPEGHFTSPTSKLHQQLVVPYRLIIVFGVEPALVHRALLSFVTAVFPEASITLPVLGVSFRESQACLLVPRGKESATSSATTTTSPTTTPTPKDARKLLLSRYKKHLSMLLRAALRTFQVDVAASYAVVATREGRDVLQGQLRFPAESLFERPLLCRLALTDQRRQILSSKNKTNANSGAAGQDVSFDGLTTTSSPTASSSAYPYVPSATLKQRYEDAFGQLTRWYVPARDLQQQPCRPALTYHTATVPLLPPAFTKTTTTTTTTTAAAAASATPPLLELRFAVVLPALSQAQTFVDFSCPASRERRALALRVAPLQLSAVEGVAVFQFLESFFCNGLLRTAVDLVESLTALQQEQQQHAAAMLATTHQNSSSSTSKHSRVPSPLTDFFADYTCNCLGYRHYALSSTVRRQVRVVVHLDLHELLGHHQQQQLQQQQQQQLKQKEKKQQPSSLPPPPPRRPSPPQSWQRVLPVLCCNCTPRPTERSYTTPDGKAKRCRHMAELVYYFVRQCRRLGEVEERTEGSRAGMFGL